jgi:hypothetical protein
MIVYSLYQLKDKFDLKSQYSNYLHQLSFSIIERLGEFTIEQLGSLARMSIIFQTKDIESYFDKLKICYSDNSGRWQINKQSIKPLAEISFFTMQLSQNSIPNLQFVKSLVEDSHKALGDFIRHLESHKSDRSSNQIKNFAKLTYFVGKIERDDFSMEK